jgi:uncharacterized protein (TIGR03083 family)
MDTVAAYRDTRERMLALTEGIDGLEPVPACPGWRIRELLSHVTGGAADILAGRLDGVGTDPWVEAQVAARADRPLPEIADEWREAGAEVDALFERLGGAPEQLVFDTVTHEHDLRGALGVPGGRDEPGLAIGLGWVAQAWADPRPGPGVRLLAGDVDVTRGAGPVAATARLGAFEALRLLTGRRSADQILGCDWDGDPEPHLADFTWGPFTARSAPLEEG